MNIDTALIRSEPHVEIGTLLQRHSDQIVDRWCRAARAEEPTARGVHHVILRDELPDFLQKIGHSLKSTGTADSAGPAQSAREHGAQRWESGWSLTDLVRDYQLLRLTVLEFLEENLARPLYYREAMAVGVVIDDAIAASISRYVAHRDDNIRTLERERTEALETLSRRKDEFLAILGHELRNPLAPIRNSLVVVRKLVDASHPAVAKSLDVLDRQTRQLGRLVDDLLDLARISRGEFELRKTRVDVKRAVEQALQATEPLVKERNHRMSVLVPASAVLVDADPARITQILANLLNNAAKYTEPGGDIALTVQSDSGDAVITVRDNGIGIAPVKLARIFEMFARVDEPQSGREGLGIGLALVQQLVQQHGGTIVASSDGLGHGAQFVVRLPLAPSTPGATSDPAVGESMLVIKQVRQDRP